ncbi:MAG: hypothetical protein H0U52_18270 [Chloroflexi bacterium]|nr:hypothetical protein [Chloroflexota bacterium]
MTSPMTAWLVESYWPTALGSPDPVAARLRAIAVDAGMRLVGVVHVPADEMALWRFDAPAADVVRLALQAAGLTFERIVAVVDLPAAAMTQHLPEHESMGSER